MPTHSHMMDPDDPGMVGPRAAVGSMYKRAQKNSFGVIDCEEKSLELRKTKEISCGDKHVCFGSSSRCR